MPGPFDSAKLERIRRRVLDSLEEAAMCAQARGETEIRQTAPMPCPHCGPMWFPRVDFGPAGWRCVHCMGDVPGPGAAFN